MTSETKRRSVESELPEAAVHEKRGFSMVWLIPIVAALVGGGVVARTLLERGPTVTIRFASGAGLEPGKTRVKYKSLVVGTVTDVALSEDLAQVVATAELAAEAAPYLNEQTVFWVVRPEISSSGISGLDALVSGSYIGVIPGHGQEPRRDFEGLAHHPLRAAHPDALQVVLEAPALGSIREGTKIYHRSIEAGEVVGYALAPGDGGVTITALIDPDFAKLVRSDTQFWNASGIEVKVGMGGVRVHTESLAALLAGGIAFDTPQGSKAPGAERGDRFPLHSSADAAERTREHAEGLPLVIEATHVGSLKEGDHVTYRQVRVGVVGRHELSADARSVKVHLRIYPRYARLVRSNSRFWNASGIHAHFGLLSGLQVDTESLESILAGGVAFATPDEPGPRVKRGTLFPLHARPEPEWHAWSPSIRLPSADPGKTVHHAIHVENHRSLFGNGVASEAVSPDGGSAAVPAVASGPDARGARKRGFFRRVLGRGGS